VASFFAYDSRFNGGVFVAVGNFDGDAAFEVVTGPGATGGPHVRVFNIVGDRGVPLSGFLAYDARFTGGVRVAAGNVDGLAGDEIITGAGPGGGPHAKVLRATGAEVFSFFAYAPAFTGGIFVAAGDVNGDSRADIITGAGASGGPHVRVFSGVDSAELHSFFAYDSGFTGGVRVAVARIDSDARADIVTGAGPTGGPHVRAFNGINRATLASFLAHDPLFVGGISVAASDFNADGLADFVIGRGSGGGRHTRLFNGANRILITEFFAYPA
jgi:hypothetical protein